jgi:DNA mismatch repair protein MutS2
VVGDQVWVAAFRQAGEVIDIDAPHGKVKVRIGDFLYSLDVSAVAKIGEEQKPAERKPRSTIRVDAKFEVGPELSVRGFSAEEAMELLDRYLDDARLAGWHEVRIVHGKGEGILRRAVGEFLAKDGRVESKRLGQWNEGGDGVTVVVLRP